MNKKIKAQVRLPHVVRNDVAGRVKLFVESAANETGCIEEERR